MKVTKTPLPTEIIISKRGGAFPYYIVSGLENGKRRRMFRDESLDFVLACLRSRGVTIFRFAFKCTACNGNDMDSPCAFPEGAKGCLRVARIKAFGPAHFIKIGG